MAFDRRKYRDFTAKDLVLTALMTAIVFLATFVPHIPIPLGYAHLGDAVIFLFALLAPRRSALFAACLGSALADFMSGFAIWIVPTLVIKLVLAEIVCRTARARSGMVRIALAFALASLWMAIAYTLAGAVLYDSFTAALASLPGLLAEGVVNSIAALAALPLLRGRLPRAD